MKRIIFILCLLLSQSGRAGFLFNSSSEALWPNGVIPYVLHPSVVPYARSILYAIETLSRATKVRLVPRSDQADYVEFQLSTRSRSSGGRVGGGQVIELTPAYADGFPNGTSHGIIHEIGHALGFAHEHQRGDRNAYVDVRWFHVSPLKIGNFTKFETGVLLTPYDFDSIMHYDSAIFSRDGQATLVKKNGATFVGGIGGAGLSPWDIHAFNYVVDQARAVSKQSIRSFYVAYLCREAKQEEVRGWLQALLIGHSVEGVRSAIANSEEAQVKRLARKCGR